MNDITKIKDIIDEQQKFKKKILDQLLEINIKKARIPKEKIIKLINENDEYVGATNEQGEIPELKDKDFQEIFNNIFGKVKDTVEQLGTEYDSNGNKKFIPKKTYEYVVSFIMDFYDINTINTDKQEMWITINDIERPNAENHIREMCRLIYGKKYNKSIAQQIIDKIVANTFVDPKDYFKEADPRYVAVNNGILDVIEKKLVPKTPDMRFFSKIPTNFNPGAKCVSFIEHINQVLDNELDKKAIQEFFGYCLVRHHKFEKAFVWLGGGRNGKSKTAEVLIKLLGHENVVNEPMSSIENYPFSMANLFGKHLNCIAEFEQEQIRSTAKFKNLTGNDEVTAPRKHQSAITFKSYAKWLILANELPSVKDLTKAFFNRVSIIKFPFTFLSKTDYDLLSSKEITEKNIKLADPYKVDKITTNEELEGVLLWALEGLHRLYDNGGFTTSQTDEDVKMIWRQSSNNFSAFADDFLKIKWDSWVSKNELRFVYNLYCARYSLSRVSDKKIKFFLSNELGVQDIQKKNEDTNGESMRVWEGISFTEKIIDLLDWAEQNGSFSYANHPFSKPTIKLLFSFREKSTSSHLNNSSLASDLVQEKLFVGNADDSSVSDKRLLNDGDVGLLSVRERVKELVHVLDEGHGVRKDVLLEESGVNPALFDEVVKSLLFEGIVFEPVVGYLKLL